MVISCSSATTAPEFQDAVEVGGIELRAEVNREDATMLRVAITLKNTTPEPARLTLSPCVHVLLFSPTQRVWEGANFGGCPDLWPEVTLQPGESSIRTHVVALEAAESRRERPAPGLYEAAVRVETAEPSRVMTLSAGGLTL